MPGIDRGVRYERDVAIKLEQLGWRVESTPTTGDFGADVIARAKDEKLVVQCKDWSTPAGLSAIQEIVYARIHYGAQTSAVVSRNGFTRAAKDAAQKAGVLLLSIADTYALVSIA